MVNILRPESETGVGGEGDEEWVVVQGCFRFCTRRQQLEWSGLVEAICCSFFPWRPSTIRGDRTQANVLKGKVPPPRSDQT